MYLYYTFVLLVSNEVRLFDQRICGRKFRNFCVPCDLFLCVLETHLVFRVQQQHTEQHGNVLSLTGWILRSDTCGLSRFYNMSEEPMQVDVIPSDDPSVAQHGQKKERVSPIISIHI